MNTIGDRLRHARETAHNREEDGTRVTQGEVADYIGIRQSSLNAIENNKNKSSDVGAEKLMRAASYLNVSFLWLATGRGDMCGDDTHLLGELQKLKGIPLFFPQHAKSRNDDEVQQTINVSREIAQNLTDQAFFTLVSDNGLSPLCETGDIVLIDPGTQVSVEDYVLVALPNYKMPIVRQVVERSADQYSLRPINRNMSEQPLDDISHLMGIVIEFRHCPATKNRINSWQEDNRKTIGNVVSMIKNG